MLSLLIMITIDDNILLFFPREKAVYSFKFVTRIKNPGSWGKKESKCRFEDTK